MIFNKKYDISIIVTCYNQANFIKDLLDELEKQLAPNIEVIIVDDYSTDNSVKLIMNHSIYKNKNVSLICNKENRMVSYTRNVGMSKAKGDYITFIDGDDNICEHYMKTLLEYIQEEQYDIFLFDYRPVAIIDGKQIDIEKANNDMVWSRLYRKSFIDKYKIKFNENLTECFGEDYDFNHRLSKCQPNIKETTDEIYLYNWKTEFGLSTIH